MEAIIPPVEREQLRAELTPERKARDTKKAGNEIYIFSAAECPSLMREIGRLREIAFRGAGGGTGKELDIDAEDLAEDGYYQLIVWDPAAEEIVGGYRFIICTDEYPRHLSTEHYFRFSDKFRRKYLPRTIELGRSFVQPSYQARGNAKKHLCAGQPLGRARCADRAGPPRQIPFRQGDDVYDLQGRGPQRPDLVPAPVLPPTGTTSSRASIRSGSIWTTLIMSSSSRGRPIRRITAF